MQIETEMRDELVQCSDERMLIILGIHYISIVVGTNAFAQQFRHTKHIKYSYNYFQLQQSEAAI